MSILNFLLEQDNSVDLFKSKVSTNQSPLVFDGSANTSSSHLIKAYRSIINKYPPISSMLQRLSKLPQVYLHKTPGVPVVTLGDIFHDNYGYKYDSNDFNNIQLRAQPFDEMITVSHSFLLGNLTTWTYEKKYEPMLTQFSSEYMNVFKLTQTCIKLENKLSQQIRKQFSNTVIPPPADNIKHSYTPSSKNEKFIPLQEFDWSLNPTIYPVYAFVSTLLQAHNMHPLNTMSIKNSVGTELAISNQDRTALIVEKGNFKELKVVINNKTCNGNGSMSRLYGKIILAFNT